MYIMYSVISNQKIYLPTLPSSINPNNHPHKKEHTFSYKRMVVWIKKNIPFNPYEPSFFGEGYFQHKNYDSITRYHINITNIHSNNMLDAYHKKIRLGHSI